MKLLSNLIGEIGAVVNTLSVSSKEKKQIEADLIAAIARQEEELRRSQAAIIGAEAQGNWLQRSCVPSSCWSLPPSYSWALFSTCPSSTTPPVSGTCWKSVSAGMSLAGVPRRWPTA